MKTLVQAVWWAAAVALASGCVGSEVTYTGLTKYPAKPEGCRIESFPSTTPNQEWEDLATVESRCHFTFGRSACIEHLQKKACRLGGDFLYAFKDGKEGESNIVIATVARRVEGGSAKSVAKVGGTPPAAPAEAQRAPSPAPPAADCDPPCSPGFKCAAGVCEPQCNPACEAGEVCSKRRVCEAAPVPTP